MPKAPKSMRNVRDPTAIRIHNVMVTYGLQEEFNIRVYEPEVQGTESRLLPAVLAYHGGGWIHGYSELEDGQPIPRLYRAGAVLTYEANRFIHVPGS